ncbi:antitoxin [Mycobacterium sp. CPCC 205372]|uniref:Antitoxin n=1 Tax=Mycobacterium hippophais TaxID=3016340 RepID=A0ABT4PMW4_9MYCO|nr:antitoxin [Mycobacterium hippophais]MCZ8377880.1 antitoxin [Mycobacterium hippophais]
MAIFDKVKNWVSKNPDKASGAIDKAANLFDQKTKGKYADKVNKAHGAARNYVNKNNPRGPGPAGQPPVPPPPPVPPRP